MSDVHARNKARVYELSIALRSGNPATVKRAIFDLFTPDAKIQLGQPFGAMSGPEALWQRVYAPLFASMPDMERRDLILMAGPRWQAETPQNWVGLGGNFMGTLRAPWLGIPAADAPVFMRYHEYLRLEDGQVVEMQALWDVPQMMLQAGVWPMPAQAGVEWMCPGPRRASGHVTVPWDPKTSERSVRQIWDMLQDVSKGTASTPESGLGGHWHEHAMWYGPTGLGSARGHAGIAGKIFQQFRSGLSRNTRHLDEGVFFADGPLVAFTGWPSGTAMHTGDGFLGRPATGKELKRCSLDFWSIEDDVIRECWVMVDVIDLYRQMGVDVLNRLG
ncbi:MAG: polyketide cyclase [Pseudomonadota bacterium]